MNDVGFDPLGIRLAAGQVEDLVGRPDKTLGAEESSRQFPVGPGGAHENGQAASADPDFKRFLGRDFVRELDCPGSASDLVQSNAGGGGRCRSSGRL
jgi:hypothetical protein